MAVLTLLVASVLIAWLTCLSVAVLRWRRNQGQPIYRRLPNGRLRFEWSVSRAYERPAAATLPGRPRLARSRP